MPGPINIIKFVHQPEATLERHWKVVIDKVSLTDSLERAVEAPVAGHWSSKTKALLNIGELEKSLTVQGALPLLICANCAASGYKSCGDLELEPFKVSFEGDLIVWEIQAPYPGIPSKPSTPLRFKFHRPQYETEVKKVLAGHRPT